MIKFSLFAIALVGYVGVAAADDAMKPIELPKMIYVPTGECTYYTSAGPKVSVVCINARQTQRFEDERRRQVILNEVVTNDSPGEKIDD